MKKFKIIMFTFNSSSSARNIASLSKAIRQDYRINEAAFINQVYQANMSITIKIFDVGVNPIENEIIYSLQLFKHPISKGNFLFRFKDKHPWSDSEQG